jgi:protein-S-isoprenylcysteine O-methyltransferase Ste14
LASTVLAMSGWRVERLTPLWVVAGGGSLALARLVMSHPRLSAIYFAATVAFYYGGNTVILGASTARRWIARHGEEAAFRRYETILGLMFVNQGLGLGAMASLSAYALPIPEHLALAAGIALAAIGLVVKVWATAVLGVDVYYYKDLFLGRPVSQFVARGPYRFLSNPMYGIGQLHAYGYAIAMRSSSGLLAAALCHALIYVFYFAVEKRFVARVYGPPRSRWDTLEIDRAD